MILIVSSLADDHTAPVLDRLRERDVDARVFDLSAFPTGLGLVADHHPDGAYQYRLRDDEAEVDLATVTAVWWRRPSQFVLDPRLADRTDANFAYTECLKAVYGLFHALDASWMNDPARDDAAGYKLYQLKVAQEVGLEVPRTRVTNDPASARAFVDERGPGDTIYKAFLAQPEAWRETRVLTPAEVTMLDDVELAPVIFQEYVPAEFDLRVTVVGHELFAVAIDASDTDYPTDYRMALGQARVEAHDLPPPVREKLRLLVDRLGLVYGAIDMRRTPDGRYVFLEVNPSGQWLFTEEPTGLPITQAVVDWFVAQDGPPAEHGETPDA
jgi:glutathione synthase/RimK-type ligase-like ATP-grasp enzyme